MLAQAQLDLKRYQTLVQQNSIARQQAEDQVFIVQQYQGTVKLDQAQVDAQTLNIAYCHIVSPVTGRVGLRLVDPGNYVQTSNSQRHRGRHPAAADHGDFLHSRGRSAGDHAAVECRHRAFGHGVRSRQRQELATGQVSAVDNQIDTTTGTVKVRAQFDNADNALFPNQFVNASFWSRRCKNVVTVPTAAIQRGSPNGRAPYVYVINADNTVVGAADHDRPDRRRA